MKIKEYIQSQETLQGKIDAIEALIEALMLEAVDSVSNSGTKIYSMDNGQTKIMTEFRSVSDVSKGIKSLEQLKNIYVSRKDGSITFLRGRLNR